MKVIIQRPSQSAAMVIAPQPWLLPLVAFIATSGNGGAL
jgi:hypothetical protein